MSSEGHRRPSRPYRMDRRARQIDETRQRIVEAAVRLHGSVGPAGTTVLGIADAAGVTRATVYRHFPDEEAMFAACSAHWLAGRQPPDPASWAGIPRPQARLRAALADLYRFYRDGEGMLFRAYRDLHALPPGRRADMAAREDGIRRAILAAYSSRAPAGPLVQAAVGHAISFWTWRSLCVDGGLSDAEAIDLLAGLVAAAARRDRPTHR